MSNFLFATVRLGKDSVADIKSINAHSAGLVSDLTIRVVCTQITSELDRGVYVFIWLGSDNNKGGATAWKQGFKAFGRVLNVDKGETYNSTSTTDIEVLYIFNDAINRLDLLREAPKAYYAFSSLPIVGIDDHANQTIRMVIENGETNNVNALFYAFSLFNPQIKDSFVKIDSKFEEYFKFNDVDQNGLSPLEELAQKVREGFIRFWEITDQHGATIETFLKHFEETLNPYISKLNYGYTNVFQIADYKQYESILSQLSQKFPEIAYVVKGRDNHGIKYEVGSTSLHYRNYLEILANSNFLGNLNEQEARRIEVMSHDVSDRDQIYLRAMRSKPFLLLAGISGTGKSRIVKEFAFKSCPDNAKLRKDKTSPGNYCLVEVKPNWHDSTELLGYESAISGSYYVTPFVKFLAKAMLYPETPFFVCLDEMNLAPVEQYFAEFLSVLESRKMVNGHIKSEPLIPADIFIKHKDTLYAALYDIEQPKPSGYSGGAISTSDQGATYGKESETFDILMSEGLRIPENLIVIGTVNMDETTHQFSRKVIDRAMTIEMNIEDGEHPFQSFFEDAKEPDYVETPLLKDLFLPRFVTAAQAIASLDEEVAEFLKTNVPAKLAALNASLNDTPFKIAYRVQNELILFFAAIKADSPEKDNDAILTEALDGIMMMKVLPRIEGDEDLLGKPLKALETFTSDNHLTASSAKVAEMTSRLDRGHFTSFWP